MTPGRAPNAPPPDLRAALADPAFYPHRPPAVEVRETHISWVFLAGDRAYKLKKPVVFPFVDYGTPERRRHMCHEEVRLNRRLAPGIYLGVRAVALRGGSLELAEEGAEGAVDYIVEMARLPEERTLDRLLAAGAAGPPELRALGRMLAEFHASAERAPAPAGAPEQVARAAHGNFETLLRFAGRPLERRALGALERFSGAFLLARRDELERRAAAGRVREGHGDLRAEHVVLDPEPVVFDCIEFDPALRHIDVANDLAFLVMDLERLGHGPAATALVEAYRDAGGDPGEDRLLAFYACYRACVRAKVACLRAEQRAAERDATERREAEPGEAELEEAEALLGTARRFAWRARLPLLIAVAGVTASGKTVLARALAAASGLTHLSSDVVRKRLAGIEPTERAAPEHYSLEFSRRTYEALGRLAAAEPAGAIVDATFRRRAERDAFRAGLSAPAGDVTWVECRAPAAVLRERALRREQDPTRVSDAGPELVERQLRELEPFDEVAPDRHLTLRTDRPTDDVLDDLEALLDAR